MKYRLILLGAIVGGLACSAAESGTVALIYGLDDPFTEADAALPVSIVISAVAQQLADGGSSDDAAITLAQAEYAPDSSVTLPAQDTLDIDVLQATLYDSNHNAIIFGRTLPEQLGDLQGTTLGIFVQRTGQFARLPSPFDASRAVPPSPIVLPFSNQYLLVANGSGSADATTAPIYDMNAWDFIAPASLPCAPLSIAPIGGTLIMIICAEETEVNGSPCAGTGIIACGYDLGGIVATTTLTPQPTSPGCKGWEAVAGGSTVVEPYGSFIVGGTRTSMAATPCVVRVGEFETTEDGGFVPAPVTMSSFSVPRKGAAAAWSSTYGLVIAGGNESASDPPVEYLSAMTSEDTDAGLPDASSLDLGLPGDLAQGPGAAILGDSLVLFGGTLPDKSLAGARVYDLNCSDHCASDAGMPKERDASVEGGTTAAHEGGVEGGADAGVTVSLATAQGFPVTASSALFVGAAGANEKGVTEAFLLSMSGSSVTSLVPVPLRVPNRRGTTSVWSPLSSVVVVGGDLTMESYIPYIP